MSEYRAPESIRWIKSLEDAETGFSRNADVRTLSRVKKKKKKKCRDEKKKEERRGRDQSIQPTRPSGARVLYIRSGYGKRRRRSIRADRIRGSAREHRTRKSKAAAKKVNSRLSGVVAVPPWLTHTPRQGTGFSLLALVALVKCPLPPLPRMKRNACCEE